MSDFYSARWLCNILICRRDFPPPLTPPLFIHSAHPSIKVEVTYLHNPAQTKEKQDNKHKAA